jgi:ribosome maturation factor RimP
MAGTKENYEERIRALVDPVLEAEGMELVLAECLIMKSRWILRLYIDKPGGVTIDDCASVSHLVGDILDVNDVVPVAYTLEISSPGLNRPLARDKDFLRYRGCRVTIKTHIKIEGVRHFRGVLINYILDGDCKILQVEVGQNVFSIPRDAVASAHLEEDLNLKI